MQLLHLPTPAATAKAAPLELAVAAEADAADAATAAEVDAAAAAAGPEVHQKAAADQHQPCWTMRQQPQEAG